MSGGSSLGAGWWVALLGWPACLAAFVALGFAIARNSRAMAITGCVLAAPMFLYLSLMPRTAWVSPAAFLLLCISAFRVNRSPTWLSAILALPSASVLLWLGYAVLNQ
jgi:hypothetical protein